ncbi:MAG: winged helix-turn-helix domain-containing protein [Methanomassiliicoccales archaeon]|nr:MAG: winged helix-turn-helix domain-containing protein [Methanomassiliicoccales archaeon]
MAMETHGLTFQEKVMLHLLNFKGQEESFELPIDVTQKGIATSIGAQRKHIPRILKKLMGKGLVFERRGRISGSSQSMKVYLLTWEGISQAKKIEKYVEDTTIKVRDKQGNVSETKVAQVNALVEGDYSLLEIINNISDKGIFEGITEVIEDESEHEEMPAKYEIYRHTLLQVWKDGRASVDEEEILEELRKLLGISEEEHIKMQERIIRYAYPVRKKLLEIYSEAYEQALNDEQITEDERKILEILREKLSIGEDERDAIEGKINKKLTR